MAKFSEKKVEEEVWEYAGKVNEDKVVEMTSKQEETTLLFQNIRALKKYFKDACDIFCLLRDRVNGLYTKTPWKTVAAMTGALLYVLSPLDLIPDFIPLIGYLDDAAVFAFVLRFADPDLTEYRNWRKNRRGE